VPLDFSVVGQSTDPFPISWTSSQALLYALGVGAGAENALDELAFTTENTEGTPQQVLPTFPAVLIFGTPRLSYGTVDLTQLVAAQQSVELFRPFPTDGSGHISMSVTGIYDKGSGAFATTESTITDEQGDILAKLGGGSFIRGEGGYGGDRGPASDWEQPSREPDVVVRQQTLPWQALLYRLSGDRNPLHSDPNFAIAGGWPRPILHGMCTYGFAGRALLHAVADSDPTRFRSMYARFSSPVLPGDELVSSFWVDGDDVLFTTQDQTGAVKLSQGRAKLNSGGLSG
jgi:acyl dehydratase